jgi:hypothetical protein
MKLVRDECGDQPRHVPDVYLNHLIEKKHYKYVCPSCQAQYISESPNAVLRCRNYVRRWVSDYVYERNQWFYGRYFDSKRP